MTDNRQFKLVFWTSVLVTIISVLILAGAIYYGLEQAGDRLGSTVVSVQLGGGCCALCTGLAQAAEPTPTTTQTTQKPTRTPDLPTADPTATVVGPTPTPTQGAPTPDPTDTPPPPTPTPDPEPTEKPKCNKGEGNGSEGCDPGNNPDKGNDDEDDGTWRAGPLAV